MKLRQDKALSLAGLAQRANKAASGEFSVEKSIKKKKAKLVLVAEDSSDNTKKMFSNMCAFYQVPIFFYSDKVSLGKAIGKEYRAAVAILDGGFAKTIMQHISNQGSISSEANPGKEV